MVSFNFNRRIKISLLLLLVFLGLLLSFNTCLAFNLRDAFGSPLQSAAGPGAAGYSTQVTAESMISLIITTALSLIGVIFLVLAIYGGYLWMTARGNDEQTTKAKNTLTNAIIGIIIVLAAYAITWFIVNQIGGKALKE